MAKIGQNRWKIEFFPFITLPKGPKITQSVSLRVYTYTWTNTKNIWVLKKRLRGKIIAKKTIFHQKWPKIHIFGCFSPNFSWISTFHLNCNKIHVPCYLLKYFFSFKVEIWEKQPIVTVAKKMKILFFHENVRCDLSNESKLCQEFHYTI